MRDLERTESAKEWFYRFFAEAKIKSQEAEKYLPQAVGQLLDYEKGKEVFGDYQSRTKESKDASVEDLLLYSLLKKISNKADPFDHFPSLTGKGAYFGKKGEKHKTVFASFNQEMQQLLQFIIIPQNFKEEDMKVSEDYYLKALENKAKYKRLDFFNEFLKPKNIGLDIFEIDNPSLKPIYEVYSGQDMNIVCGMDVRQFLKTILDENEVDLLDEIEDVLFYREGIFIENNNEIKLMAGNDKYHAFFSKSGHIQPKGFSTAQGAGLRFREYEPMIKNIIKQKAKTCIPESSQELKTRAIKDLTGIFIPTESLRKNKLMEQEEYLECLSQFLQRLKPILAKFYKEFLIQRPSLDPQKLPSIGELSIKTKTDEMALLSPGGYDKFLNGTLLPKDLETDDLTLLQAYPNYKNVIYKKMWVRIFGRLLKVEDENNILGKLKNLIGQGQLMNERKKLVQKGFRPLEKRAEEVVLLQYFSHFGTVFLMEQDTGEKMPQLPESFRQFFKEEVLQEKVVLEDKSKR